MSTSVPLHTPAPRRAPARPGRTAELTTPGTDRLGAGAAAVLTHAPHAPAAAGTDEAAESSTRDRILRLVVEAGPVSVVEMAERLALTAAGVRRHVAALEGAGQVQVHEVHPTAPARRGRPARRYVATGRGQAALSSAYSDLATRALGYVAALGGDAAVERFAAERAEDLRTRHGDAVEAAGADVAARTAALARALGGDGYAASTRPVPNGRAVQLCQGHCPVQDVAARFPQLCEAEARVFSQMLGVHVQRLSTLASGGHVCTTHVPTTVRPTDRPAPTVEGTR